MDSIIFASTTDIAQAIREKRLSSAEVTSAYLHQIERVNPALNAVVTLDAEGALERARKADAALARGEYWGALHGVPFTLKDSHSTAGMRTTAGHPPLRDYMPQHDSTVTARLKAAGGILMGKTNVSPLLVDIQSYNAIFGVSNNPYHLGRTPGGSSGGAAAAVASGMTAFEIGSDIGGSIRIPAHFCGIFGLKPTENRVSEYGHIPDLPDSVRVVRRMSAIGPMARSMDDLMLLFSLIAGADIHDTEVPPLPVEAVPDVQLADLRLAVAPTFGDFPVSATTRAALDQLAQQLQGVCKRVGYDVLPHLDYTRDRLSEPENLTTAAMTSDEPISLKQYIESLQKRDETIIAWEQFFQEWDALICPVSMITAFEHCEMGTPHLVDGAEVRYWMANAHCKMFNHTGHPALSIPYTHDAAGLPIGVQVVTKRWGEAKLLGIARALTNITGGFVPPTMPFA